MIQNLLLYCENGCLLDVCGKEAAIMDEEFTYFMGVRIDGEVPSDMECMTINPQHMGCYSEYSRGMETFIYSEWIPTSGYELADLPCIECYYPPKHKPKHELWVPVVPK